MKTSRWTWSLVMGSFLATGLVAQDAEGKAARLQHHPGDDVTVAAHFSRWDYPKTFKVPEGCQVHVVEKGDTLWDLGAAYLGNPFAWPQIWEKNPWIKDAHWIYPGDHLVVPVGAKAVAKADDVPGGTPDELRDVQPERSAYRRVTVPEWAFSFQDFIQLPYLAPEGWSRHVSALHGQEVVEAQAKERMGVGDGDRILVLGGEDVGAKVGDRKVILKRVRKGLEHPDPKVRKGRMGDVVQQVGVARLVQIQPKGSVAVIERSLDAVERGDVLIPFNEPANIPFRLRTDVQEPMPSNGPDIRVIYTLDNRSLSGNGGMLIVDKGTQDGLKVGDILVAIDPIAWEGKGSAAATNRPVGQVMVIRVGERDATVRVLRSIVEVTPGSHLVK